jgi:hypothetical protein
MAKNTGKGHRVGAVKGRSEFKHPNGTYVKRDTKTGASSTSAINLTRASATSSRQ